MYTIMQRACPQYAESDALMEEFNLAEFDQSLAAEH